MYTTAVAHRCPNCKRTFEPEEGDPWRPFCSERCRLVDLGRWLDGDYRIPGPAADGAEGPPGGGGTPDGVE